MKNKKIAILGCGNLGLSILNGLLSTSEIKPEHITITKRNIEPLNQYKLKGVNVTNNNLLAVKNADVIILALKPYNVMAVLQEIKPGLGINKQILVSVATGVSIAAMTNEIQMSIPIFRAMPNTAADVGTSMTCICGNVKENETIKTVEDCFNAIGETIMINENLMDAATVLGACGIAYVLRFIRGMVQGGIQIGFDSKTASQIVNQTVKGAAELLLERNEHPEFEIDKVTTPKGCTIAGLNEMEHNGFSSALIKGIVTSFDAIDK